MWCLFPRSSVSAVPLGWLSVKKRCYLVERYDLFEENEGRGGVCGHMCPSFMVFGFKLDVSRLLNRVDKTVLVDNSSL